MNRLGKLATKQRPIGTGSNMLYDTSGRTPVASAASGAANWVLPSATVDMDFQNGLYYGGDSGGLTTTRALANATSLTPASTSGAAYVTYPANIARIVPGSGLLIEESRVNQLFNSTAPVTQTTPSLATGTYTLWVNGSGSALASGNTATITGAASASNGSPNTFVVTVLGTVDITVTGSLNAFQCELGSFGTSLIVTAGATATRAADVITLSNTPFTTWSSLSMYAKVNLPQLNTAIQYRVLTVANAAVTDEVQIRNNGSAFWLLADTAGTSVSVASSFSTGVNTIAAAVTTGDAAIGFNGGTVATGVNGAMPSGTPSKVTLGGSAITAARLINGYLQRIALWPTIRLSNGMLKIISGI